MSKYIVRAEYGIPSENNPQTLTGDCSGEVLALAVLQALRLSPTDKCLVEKIEE